jgi:undecaprenyl-diphosphatase
LKRTTRRLATLAVAAGILSLVAVALLRASGDPDHRAASPLSIVDAAVLGVVEGATEFLPVSSTGHLVVAERLLDVATDEDERDAVDSYLIVVQGGAIAAVLAVYRRRIAAVARGVLARGSGRRLGVELAIASLPALAVAALAGEAIKEGLLEPGPVAAAWLLGGALLVCVSRTSRLQQGGLGRPIECLGAPTAVVIGCAQVVALWPGVSRSLVTILAGLAAGLSMAAAVEFSFLLGAIVLTIATGYELVTGASLETLGPAAVVGVAVSFLAALAAVRWMVTYLQRHDLAIFGWYRIALGVVVLALLAGGSLR